MYLIVVGHTTMSRVTFGKLPEKTLRSITDQARHQSLEEVVDLLRIIRLMSMAEIAAALGDSLTREQGKELFTLYDEAIRVAADPHLDWDALHDQHIAALGGAQNLAVRQILKLCNLFEYLDTWTDLADKGPFQRDALANYNKEELDKINQVIELVGITNDFKERYYEGEIIDRPYFFRKLLGCQFHGTGHLFPLLGTRAGFILLWITINASPGSVINFNPLISYDLREGDDRPLRVKAELEALDGKHLHFGYLGAIKKTLAQGKSAFIFNTGIQLRHNPLSQATEVTFIDVAGNLRKVEQMLESTRERWIPEMPLAELKEADRLFRELSSYDEHLGGIVAGNGRDVEAKTRLKSEISHSCARMLELFARKLFIPQYIYDNLGILHEHCPNIGRHLLSEFWELYRIKPTQKIYDGETVPSYVFRCLKKFQALVNREREALQNTELFYQLAQQQFGPMAGESIGASNAQIETLEELIGQMGSRPGLLEALGAALLFQEIGKLSLHLEEYKALSKRVSHAGAGAEILRRRGVLRRFGMKPKTSRLVEFLVEVHGLVGHVLRGEVALPALEMVTRSRDELVFVAFFLHSVLAAAAYREGVMVEDLLDRFLNLRQVALQVSRGEMSWQSQMKRVLTVKGRSLLTETVEAKGGQTALARLPEWDDLTGEGGLYRKGAAAAAVERLFRLLGLPNINFVDAQMKILGMPVTFIYHKKGLKSTGLPQFEGELEKALAAYEALSNLDDEIRRNLLEKLSPQEDMVRIYGFECVAHYLEPENWLKLLVLAFRGVDRYLKSEAKPWVVSFMELSPHIDCRHEALSAEFTPLSMNRLVSDGRLLARITKAKVGLMLRYSRSESVVMPLFKDRHGVGRVLERIRHEEDILHLKDLYHRELKRLKSRAHHTEDYQRQLSVAFHGRVQELIELTLRKAEEKMRRQRGFTGLERVFTELLALVEENGFSEEQIQQVKDMYEFNRDRLRNQRLKEIYQNIQGCTSASEVVGLWKRVRAELIGNRRHLGKEFENLVTRRFDEQLESFTKSQ
jgi:hypothetical protein